jgi:phage/plasmid-associated DNA primase
MMDAYSLSAFDNMISQDLDYTHRKLQPYETKLNLSSRMPDFWLQYCTEVSNNYNKEEPSILSYVERGSDYTHINVTMVFKYDLEDRIEYTSTFIAIATATIQYTINEVYDLPLREGNDNDVIKRSPLYCCVLYGNDQYQDDSGEFCHAISFRFPRCVVSTSSQVTIFRNRLIDNLRRNNILHFIPMSKNTSLESIICTTPPMGDCTLYGSMDNHIKTSFRFENLLDEIPLENLSRLDEDGVFPIQEHIINLEECELFNPGIHVDCTRYGFDPLSLRYNVIFWMPLILSVGFYNVRTNVRKLTTQGINQVIAAPVQAPHSDTDVSVAQSLIGMIQKRTPEDWIIVGKALYNSCYDPIFKGKPGLNTELDRNLEAIALSIWKTGLVRCEYNLEEFLPLWDDFNHDNNFTVRTIAWLAKQDSLTNFQTWTNQWLQNPIKRAVESSKNNDHMAVGNVFYRCFWLEYAYVEGVGKGVDRWYRYKDHHWNAISDTEMKEPVLRFREHIEQSMTTMVSQMNDCRDQNKKDLLNNQIKLATELYNKLGQVGWIKNIIIAAKTFFIIPNFEKLANDNKNITGVRNGVIEVNEKEAFFRVGRPEDYITKFTNIAYDRNLHRDHKLVREYLKFIGEVFPDSELVDLMLRFFSSLLLGIPSKFFYIWTGVGDNGKSTTVKLLNATLGDDYVANISPTFITMKRGNSSNASPELAALRHCRLVVIQEPDEGEQLKAGKIKEATGGDKIRARALFENGGPIDPTYQIVLQCNTIPEAKKEQAMTNRIMIIPFLSVWKDANDMPQTREECLEKHIFKKDPTFMATVQKFAPACLYMMVQHFKFFKENPISTVPKIVTDHTNSYWAKVDVFSRYLHERIVWVYSNRTASEQESFVKDPNRPLDPNVSLSQYDVYADFVSWFRETGRNTRVGGEIPIYDRVVEEYTKVLGEPGYYGWPSVALKTVNRSNNM